AHVAVEKQPDVGNAVPEHRDPLGSHAPRESGVLLAVDLAVLEHSRVHHAGAKDFHPPRLLTGGAARSTADLTLHVHFRRRLSEREVRWTKPHFCGRREDPSRKCRERGLEVDERQTFVLSEPFDLLEYWRVRCIERIPAITAARNDDPDRRRICLQGPDLNR